MIDAIIVIAYLLVTLFIGLHAARQVKTEQQYSIGNSSFSSFAVLATLFSSFIGGGFTIGLAEKTYTYGIVFIFCVWGFSFKEFLIAHYIVPKIAPLRGKIETIGDLMHLSYGKEARIITGIASVLVCGGIIGAQISASGNIIHMFLGIPHDIGSTITMIMIIFYTTIGGMVSVVMADILHFSVLIVLLPLVLIFGLHHVGGFHKLMLEIPIGHLEPLGEIGLIPFLILFLTFFFGETLVPPYFQRLFIGKTNKVTERGTLYSAILSLVFFSIVGLIGIVALHINAHIPAHLALPMTIHEVMPVGLRGLAIAAMLAVVMSSADSFLNATSIAIKKDILVPCGYKMSTNTSVRLLVSQVITLTIGIVALIFSLLSESVINLLLYSYQFWTPFILVPLISAIYGCKSNARTFVGAAVCGIFALIWWQLFEPYSIGISGALEGVLFGILINAITFSLLLTVSKKAKS